MTASLLSLLSFPPLHLHSAPQAHSHSQHSSLSVSVMPVLDVVVLSDGPNRTLWTTTVTSEWVLHVTSQINWDHVSFFCTYVLLFLNRSWRHVTKLPYLMCLEWEHIGYSLCQLLSLSPSRSDTHSAEQTEYTDLYVCTSPTAWLWGQPLFHKNFLASLKIKC